MPSHPYPNRLPPITDPETVAAWADYEARSARAAAQYRHLPITLNIAGVVKLCGCGRSTTSRYGVCWRCLRGTS